MLLSTEDQWHGGEGGEGGAQPEEDGAGVGVDSHLPKPAIRVGPSRSEAGAGTQSAPPLEGKRNAPWGMGVGGGSCLGGVSPEDLESAPPPPARPRLPPRESALRVDVRDCHRN